MQVNPARAGRRCSAGRPRAGLIPVKAGGAMRCHAGAMAYLLLLLVHLLAALAFAGTVLFEVLFLPGGRRQVPAVQLNLQAELPAAVGLRLEAAFAARAHRVMPWVLLALYAAGIGLAWHHRGALAHPLDSRFALLLSAKIALAASVAGHFLLAMAWQRRGRLSGPRSRRLHRSVLLHVLAIALLAKAMFHL